MPSIVLASSSPYRRMLLDKLGLRYTWESPDVDETALPDESPLTLVQRLARAKASALALRHPQSLIIGSDQVAVIDNSIIGKPGSHEQAIHQLRRASGKTVTFFTGLCLLDSSNNRAQVNYDSYIVHFRDLAKDQIENYLIKEQPYDCAGSFKAEGLGISLFKALEGRDPNTLVGLPLIALVDMLLRVGIDPLGKPD